MCAFVLFDELIVVVLCCRRAWYWLLAFGSLANSTLKEMQLFSGELSKSLSFAELAVRRSTVQKHEAKLVTASVDYVVTDTDGDGDPTEVEWRGLKFRLQV
jgi:hypothetical protein